MTQTALHRFATRHGRVAAAAAVALGTALAAGPASAIVTDDGGLTGLPASLNLGGVGQLATGCSSVLLAGGSYLLASAHCAAAAGSTVSFNGGAVTATVASTTFSPDYNGTPLGDLSLSKLSAPVTGVAGYALAATPLLPVDIVLAGYGLSGSGASGASGPAGSLRYGYNQYETLLADDPPELYFGTLAGFDFDDGSAAMNRFGSTGLRGEAMLANGDSGGPSFAFQGGEWRIAGIHSGVDDRYGFGFGAVGYDVLVGRYAAWIDGATALPVPEPATAALLLAGLAGVLGRATRVSNLARCTLK